MPATQVRSVGQVSRTAADVYEEFFVPAIFGEWSDRLADASGVQVGHRVLDVACGTGAFARAAASRVAPDGSVSGLDRNDGMLAVARRMLPGATWHNGLAESLPFEDAIFDVVACQFGLMFFEDRTAALREMWRVLRPGGRLAVGVWDSIDKSPGYADMAKLLDRLFGAAVANELHAPFVLGDVTALRALLASAGIANADIRSVIGSARFPSIRAWVETEIKGWTLADRLDDAQFEQLARQSEKDLAHYANGDGRVAFAFPALFITAEKLL